MNRIGVRFAFLLNLVAGLWILFSTGNSDYDYFRLIIGIVFLFVLPGWLIGFFSGFVKVSQEFWQQGLIGFILGSSLVTSFVYFLGHFFNLSSGFQWGGLAAVYLAGGFLLWRMRPGLKFPILSWGDAAIFTLFNILFYCFIAPTQGLLVPPLHDPTANVIIADKLSRFGFSLAQFPKFMSGYPPGAAYWTALLCSFTRVDAARAVLFTTNFMSLLCGFSLGLFLITFLKKRGVEYLGIIVLCMYSVSISRLYFTAGKNSQIFGYFFLFASFWAVTVALRAPGLLSNGVALTVSLFAIMIHYNNIVILPLGLLCIALTAVPELRKYSRQDWAAFGGAFLYFVVGLLLLFWELTHTRSGGHIIPGHSGAGSVAAGGLFVRDFWSQFGKVLMDLPSFLGFEKHEFFRLTALSGVYLSVVASVLSAIWRREYSLLFLPLFGLCCIVPHFVSNRSIQHYSSLNDFIPFLFFSVFGIYVVFVKLRRFPVLFTIGVGAFLIYGIDSLKVGVYDAFTGSQHLSPVSQADLKAFAWIRNNTDENDYFLPANIVFTNGVSFQTDASMYLKVFAQRQEFLGFTAGDVFEDQNSHDIMIFRKLAGDLTSRDALTELRQRNVRYVYLGAYHYWGEGIVDWEKYPSYYKKVYDNDGAKIFKIDFAILDRAAKV
ncbi:hypothetical protein WDW86_00745 [Bdellovibrionota bacterium FG-2]